MQNKKNKKFIHSIIWNVASKSNWFYVLKKSLNKSDSVLRKSVQKKISISASLTDVVPAASSSGTTDPVSLKHADLPVALCVVGQVIRGHVADLYLVVVSLEVLKLHPGVTNTITVISQYFYYSHFGSKHINADYNYNVKQCSKGNRRKQIWLFS